MNPSSSKPNISQYIPIYPNIPQYIPQPPKTPNTRKPPPKKVFKLHNNTITQNNNTITQ